MPMPRGDHVADRFQRRAFEGVRDAVAAWSRSATVPDRPRAPGRGSSGRCPAAAWFRSFSSSGETFCGFVHWWPRGTATTKGSSYSGCTIRPESGKGSAMMAQSSSPCRSSSISLTVKFSCSISGICGTEWIMLLDQRRQQVGPDGVDHADAQRAGQRVLALLGDFADRRGLLQHPLRLARRSARPRRSSTLPRCRARRSARPVRLPAS